MRVKGGKRARPLQPIPEWILRVGSRLTPDDLDIIAGADYGTDAAAHRRALDAILRGDASVVAPLAWIPREVLQLTRNERPAPSDTRSHLRRLFACGVLLHASAQPGSRAEAVAGDAIVAIRSLLQVAREEAGGLVALLEKMPSVHAEESVFFALGVFLLLEGVGADVPQLLASMDTAIALAGQVEPEEPGRASRRRKNEVRQRYRRLGRGAPGAQLDSWIGALDKAQARCRLDPARQEVAARIELLATL